MKEVKGSHKGDFSISVQCVKLENLHTTTIDQFLTSQLIILHPYSSFKQ